MVSTDGVASDSIPAWATVGVNSALLECRVVDATNAHLDGSSLEPFAPVNLSATCCWGVTELTRPSLL